MNKLVIITNEGFRECFIKTEYVAAYIATKRRASLEKKFAIRDPYRPKQELIEL